MSDIQGLFDFPIISGLFQKAYKILCFPAYMGGLKDGLIAAGLVALIFFLLRKE